MKNQLKLKPFEYGPHELRTVIIDDEPHFLAIDICRSLNLSDTNKALKGLDDDEKLKRTLFVSGQNREVYLVNESGLYNLIFRSNKPNAKAFRKWVTSEVLPQIRKRGTYSLIDTDEKSLPELVRQGIAVLGSQVALAEYVGYSKWTVRAALRGGIGKETAKEMET